MTISQEELFQALNDKLAREDITLTVICVGGSVLDRYGIRATHDIDGFFRADHKIRQMIRDVGEIYGANTAEELWLNDAVASMNPVPPEELCEVILQFSHLTVLQPPLDYVAGMKLYSGREQDIDDVAAILRLRDMKDPVAFANELASYGFAPPDEALLLEAFGRAYGMAWLERYYTTHEEEINQRILNKERGL